MSNAQLETAIEAAWEARDSITPATTGETREAIEDTLNALDGGGLRVAEKQDDGSWHVNQWAKKAVLLGFRLKDMELQGGSAQGGSWWDKVDSKWKDWGAWYESMGAAVVDGGGPAGMSKTVSAEGVADNGGANPVSGLTIVEAADQDAACEMAKGCPMVVDGNGSVEVAEVIQM